MVDVIIVVFVAFEVVLPWPFHVFSFTIFYYYVDPMVFARLEVVTFKFFMNPGSSGLVPRCCAGQLRIDVLFGTFFRFLTLWGDVLAVRLDVLFGTFFRFLTLWGDDFLVVSTSFWWFRLLSVTHQPVRPV